MLSDFDQSEEELGSGKAISNDPDDQLLHDIAVPRYSAIGTVTPNRLVLVGVYLLFVPGSIYCLLLGIDVFYDPRVPSALRLLIAAAYVCGAGVSFLIVYKTHKRYVAAKRIAAGLCGVCGYDLRATAAQCPECGTLSAEQ